MDRELQASFEIARLSTVTDHIGDIVIRLQYGVVSWASPSITEQLGGSVENWIGVQLRDLVHPDDVHELRYAGRLIVAGETAKAKLRLKAPGGDYRWLSGVITPTNDGGVDDVIVSCRVIDDEIAREAALEELAKSDALTGLANRRELLRQLHQMLDRHRYSDHVAILFCDLDNLKQINDGLGHHAGDIVLIAVAERLKTILRRDDVPARVGGDEFAVALAGIVDVEHALETADKVRRAIAEVVAMPDVPDVTATASIGVALGRPGEDPADLLRRADEAMYDAKREGGDRVVVAG